MYTPKEPVISPFKRINRPLKTDYYNGTTYNGLRVLASIIIFSIQLKPLLNRAFPNIN